MRSHDVSRAETCQGLPVVSRGISDVLQRSQGGAWGFQMNNPVEGMRHLPETRGHRNLSVSQLLGGFRRTVEYCLPHSTNIFQST